MWGTTVHVTVCCRNCYIIMMTQLTGTVQMHRELPATAAVQTSHFPLSTRNRPVGEGERGGERERERERERVFVDLLPV